MMTFDQAVQYTNATTIVSSFPFTKSQFEQLQKLNLFAIHQACNDEEVRLMPAKMIYKVNEEFKLALMALLVTCAVMDFHRQGRESKEFFDTQIKITQKKDGRKVLNFGIIRANLLERFLIPEIVDDWITYRDVNGDGIHALARKKIGFIGISGYEKGGEPLYEFVRFYHKLMERKQRKSEKLLEQFQQEAIHSLANKVVEQQLLEGLSPDAILKSLTDETKIKKTPQRIKHSNDPLLLEDDS
ncbi:MAG: hypothetical protein J6Y85_04585 [Alphaproteobacteria bacterium]|nr:hypothetical protein [Alphaproteobacteria bacterium]